MCANNASSKPSRLPEWLRIKLPDSRSYSRTRSLLASARLHTVCQSAKCPNIYECFSRDTATFMILGNTCTRCCAFCNVDSVQGRGQEAKSRPEPVDPGEPARVAAAARELGLAHVVVTSVTRDDLTDGGASQFAAVCRALKQEPGVESVELLVPDFQGDVAALDLVLAEQPSVLNHNLETVPRLYGAIRRGADYQRSLALLKHAADAGAAAKSGLMVGLGESDEELRRVLGDMAQAGCAMVTLGQYLAPSRRHPWPDRFVEPGQFERYAEWAKEEGIPHVASAPLVRSSYKAENISPCRG
ncbi:MAG: lipoyl synthase [Desulfovibrio sp.]|nr:MAG: lipoyl synthase [Desulfovibrio sp.]